MAAMRIREFSVLFLGLGREQSRETDFELSILLPPPNRAR